MPRVARLIFALGMFLPLPCAAEDITDLTRLFVGIYDSREQWDMEDSANLLERDRHPWTTAVHTAIALPEIGKNVFFVEEYVGGKPAQVVRQRLVSFVPDGESVRMTQYEFKARVPAAKRASISVGDLLPMPGCDVMWKVNADFFWEGALQKDACKRTVAGRARLAEFEGTLNMYIYQRVDREFFADTGKLADGFAEDLPTMFRRVTVAPNLK